MANLTRLTADLNIIAKLDDEPNDVGGLTAAELKGAFDRAGNTIKTYLNETLLPETEALTGEGLSAHAADTAAHADQFVQKADKAALDAHLSSRANPHHITAAQIGADPAGAASDAVYLHEGASDAHQSQFDEKADKLELRRHVTDQYNPHHVTAAQVGADPAGTASSAVAAHADAADAHQARFEKKADKAALDAHTADRKNPHHVTAAQIGADPAGAASDAVYLHQEASDAHQAQFDEKADKLELRRLTVQLGDKQNKLTGKAGQVVGFNAAGEAVAVTLPQTTPALLRAAPALSPAPMGLETAPGALTYLCLQETLPQETLTLTRPLTAEEQAALDALGEGAGGLVFLQLGARSSWWFLRRDGEGFQLWSTGGDDPSTRTRLTLEQGMCSCQVDTACRVPLKEGTTALSAPAARYYAGEGPAWIHLSGEGWTALTPHRDGDGPCWMAAAEGYAIRVSRGGERPCLRIWRQS